MYHLFEGGNAIPTSKPVDQADVPTVIATTKREMPQALLKNLETDIGSAGFKTVPSGDIDLMVDAEDVVALFKTLVLAAAKVPYALGRLYSKTTGACVGIAAIEPETIS